MNSQSRGTLVVPSAVDINNILLGILLFSGMVYLITLEKDKQTHFQTPKPLQYQFDSGKPDEQFSKVCLTLQYGIKLIDL